ncbi:MAG: hypothetical protein QOG84_73 [Sphingomonadales bacterium]|jgi:hypothetical protein|nr:hypothetical protein [Sphingomonadales bacterium]
MAGAPDKGAILTNKGFAFAGAGVLAAGLFMPIVTLPLVGTINLFNNGTNIVALVLLALAGIAAGLALKDRESDVIWPGAAAALILLYLFLKLQYSLSQMRGEMAKSLQGNPFAGLAQTAMGGVQLQWGWIVLALGAGLLIYAGVATRKGAGVPLVGLNDKAAKAIAGICVALLVVALAWDWIGRPRAAAVPDMAMANTLGPMTESSALPASDESKPSAEEAAYIRDNLRLYDLKAKYYDSLLDGRVPGVDFKIKNNGTRTLNRVKVRVVFQDKAGLPIAEEEYNPVWVVEGGYSPDENKPLRSNYIWQNEPDKFYVAKSVPSEWEEGKASATITDIEFAPN